MGGCISRPPIQGKSSFRSSPRLSDYAGGQSGHFPQREPLPPPDHGESSSVTTYANQDCDICFTHPKDLAFGCGHQICCECAERFYFCPFCRDRIRTKVKPSSGSHQIWCPLCPMNQRNPKDMVFDCGHQTCSKCGESLQCCPECHKTIKKKIKLY